MKKREKEERKKRGKDHCLRRFIMKSERKSKQTEEKTVKIAQKLKYMRCA